MINVREFIKQLGDKAPDFFGTKKETIARWLKTGNIPFKAVEKVLVADETLKQLQGGNQVRDLPEPQPDTEATPPEIDPLTKLPVSLDRRLPQIPQQPGHQPQVIEMSPTEQNWGVNLTRPGRINAQPMPPMKIRKENGQSIPYVEQPAPVKELPPEIGGGEAGWSNRGQPIPQPKRDNERPLAPKPTESVSEAKV